MFPMIEGMIESYDVIFIGHQRCNVYFGENPQNPPRGKPVSCTCTMIRGKQEDGSPYVLLIDPTTRNSADEFYFELSRRTGLHPEDVTHCFCTHEHFDHIEGFSYFPKAQWLVAAPNLPWASAALIIDKARLHSVQSEFLPGVYAVPLPGHTHTLHGVAFRHDGKRFVVTGDAVVSRHHFKDNANNYEDDVKQAIQTQIDIKKDYDIVIPGHDNLFLI